jgi:hypothetical protein
MPITITVDPKANGQMIWSPDLGMFLQIYLITQDQLNTQLTEAQNELLIAQQAVTSIQQITAQAAQPNQAQPA